MVEANDNPLQAEIMAEKASAYFARVRKMQAAVEALVGYDRQGYERGQEENGRREELLEEAGEQVWFFLIQREAMRLPYYEELFADFEIPDEVRRRMGPKRGGAGKS